VNGFLTFLLFITDSVDLGVIGRRLEDVLILLLNLVWKVKFSLSAAEFVFFRRRLSHSSHSFGHSDCIYV